jgi:hypothetical protein
MRPSSEPWRRDGSDRRALKRPLAIKAVIWHFFPFGEGPTTAATDEALND